MAKDEIEAVAQAFYYSLEGARDWEREPELLKERFRRDARAAIEALNGHRDTVTSRDIPPLAVPGELGNARELLMNSQEVSVLPVPGFRAFRTVLRGADHTFEVANDPYFGLVGHRELLGRPVREALPELRGQGYYELLDHVYQTRKAFVGRMMRIMVQPKPSAPLEEHIIDFVYRPIENASGQVTGLFVEGYDRTEWARA
ncbi:PAS domain-containing protein [Microvirga makkahensis]|uniref:PAS domain-containing protein n=1 Tax=Microvirga makkahensis TaxID=1128670 RepID=A0A7X3MUM9_9HYPH|nr:PAS domain-containing protein [Microvirga makkahensis]MXQ13542.1 PAS domain-containing protein [Microvirga makkahensis]